MNRVAFVERVQKACAIAKLKGAIINADAVIAQAALESGWGNSSLAEKHNNLFGQKAGTLWTGPTVDLWTREWYGGAYHKVVAKWRVFPSWNECIVDYSKFISERQWFKDALPHADPPDGDGDTRAWIEKLVDVDYPGEMKWATGPDYVTKVMRQLSEVNALRAKSPE